MKSNHPSRHAGQTLACRAWFGQLLWWRFRTITTASGETWTWWARIGLKLSILLSEFRILCCELGLLRRRVVMSLDFLAHPDECALYFAWRRRPLDKPNYVFKTFDKLHSSIWPNDQAHL